MGVRGERGPQVRALPVCTRGGGPLRAIVLQQGLGLILVATGSFEAVPTYASCTLSVFSVLTVLGVVVLRYNEPQLPRPYRVRGYPLTPAFFVLVNALILGVALYARPLATGAGLVIALARHRRRGRRACSGYCPGDPRLSGGAGNNHERMPCGSVVVGCGGFWVSSPRG